MKGVPEHQKNTRAFEGSRVLPLPWTLAPEEGLEPPTNRLTAECNVSDFDNLQPNALGSPKVLQSAAEHARHLLIEIAAGRWDLMLAIKLATTVMNDPVNRLATEILTLGPHTVERTVELAEALVRAVEQDVVEVRGGRR